MTARYPARYVLHVIRDSGDEKIGDVCTEYYYHTLSATISEFGMYAAMDDVWFIDGIDYGPDYAEGENDIFRVERVCAYDRNPLTEGGRPLFWIK